MNFDAIIHDHPARWVDDDTPFLLWEIGTKTVLEHWVDSLFEINGTLTLWLEQADERVSTYIDGRFPLCERARVRLGAPRLGMGEASSYIDEHGRISFGYQDPHQRYLCDQDPVSTWFAMVRHWLHGLQAKGSAVPELEKQIQPGVFVGHHCHVSSDTVFHPPCWIGSGTDLQSAVIGPDTVVGENCIVAGNTQIARSYVLKNTCVGRNQVLDGVVAGSSRLLNHADEAFTQVADRAVLRRI